MAANYSPAFFDRLAEEEFTREGYTKMPLLSAAEIETLTQLYLNVVPSLPSDFFSTAFLNDCPERRAMTEGVQAVLEPHIARLMPNHTLYAKGYIVKRGGPDQKPLRLHQDYSYVDHALHRAVHLWIPLIDVDVLSGCLTVIPRTHHLINHISAMIDNPSPYDPVRHILDTECTIPVPMKAGEAVFFDQRLYHGSTKNLNPATRVALACALLPTGATQLLYVVDEVDPSKLNVLEVRDEFTVRYSRGVKVVPPYPDGVKKIGQVEYTAEVLSKEKLDSLRIRRPEVDTAPKFMPKAVEKQGFLSKLLGHH